MSRRPLFTNGYPQVCFDTGNAITAPDDAVEVLNLQDELPRLPAGTLVNVTLFSWWLSELNFTPSLGIQNLSTGEVLALLNTETVNSSTVTEPVKLLDRFAMTASDAVSTRLLYGSEGDDNSTSYIWGYYEVGGARREPIASRPLDTTAANGSSGLNLPAMPVNAEPGDSVAVHGISDTYVDEITLSANAFLPEIGGTLPSATSLEADSDYPGLTFPNDTRVPLLTAGYPTQFLDGIPMRADDSGDQIVLDVPEAFTTSFSAWGRFSRR